jgi:hypothetical protein
MVNNLIHLLASCIIPSYVAEWPIALFIKASCNFLKSDIILVLEKTVILKLNRLTLNILVGRTFNQTLYDLNMKNDCPLVITW